MRGSPLRRRNRALRARRHPTASRTQPPRPFAPPVAFSRTRCATPPSAANAAAAAPTLGRFGRLLSPRDVSQALPLPARHPGGRIIQTRCATPPHGHAQPAPLRACGHCVAVGRLLSPRDMLSSPPKPARHPGGRLIPSLPQIKCGQPTIKPLPPRCLFRKCRETRTKLH